MFIWSKTATLIATLLISFTVSAQNFQCGKDLNFDGDLDDIGELESCLTSDNNDAFCPIGAVDCESEEILSCPGSPSNECINGSCTVDTKGECRSFAGGTNWRVYVCVKTGVGYQGSNDEQASRTCLAQCNIKQTRSCVSEKTDFACPFGDEYKCRTHPDSKIIPQCTSNVCEDITVDGVVETLEEFDSSMHVDDGERDAEGACLGESRLFSGRPMSCRLPGLVSVYKNCCTDNNGKIYHDSKGNIVEDTLTNKAIIATAAAAWAAGSAFSAAAGAGASTTQAAQAGGKAFVNSLQGAFDPTTLAIAVAIALIQHWLANACDQESMETAALSESGYCFKVGLFCSKKVFGSCVQKNEVKCCYNSKLARIVNEQGIEQLTGISPIINQEIDQNNLQALDCGGFTPEQFQALDFQKIDFSEYQEDINAAVSERINEEGDQAIERFTDNEVTP